MEQKIVVEIRVGTGGKDSSLLIQDQYKIYYNVCKLNNLWLTLIEDCAGLISFSIEGKNCYEIFKNESGAIRWVRTPPTEKRGRTHTSIITVAVLKIPEKTELNINESDIEFRFIKSFGNGGQSSQKNMTGVFAKHLPTNIEAKCTSERSQLSNKNSALEVLKSRLYEIQQNKSAQNTNDNRRSQITSGNRAEKSKTIKVNDNIVKDEITGRSTSYKQYSKGYINF